jgi:hypothetical protein
METKEEKPKAELETNINGVTPQSPKEVSTGESLESQVIKIQRYFPNHCPSSPIAFWMNLAKLHPEFQIELKGDDQIDGSHTATVYFLGEVICQVNDKRKKSARDKACRQAWELLSEPKVLMNYVEKSLQKK